MSELSKEAEALARILGEGWVADAWGSQPLEFEAKKDGISVYPRLKNGEHSYMASMTFPSINNTKLQFVAADVDPRWAVTRVLTKLDTYIETLQNFRKNFPV